MKRRFLAGVLVSFMAFSMVACGSQPAAPSDAVVEEDDTEETADKADFENEDTEPVIEVIEGYKHSDEYIAAFEKAEVYGFDNISTGTGDLKTFSDWKEAYKDVINETNSMVDRAEFTLIYVNDDEIPELVYTSYGIYAAVVTFDGSTTNTWNGMNLDFTYVPGQNVLYSRNSDDVYYYDNVLSIKDGKWVMVAMGAKMPEDIMSEDSFDPQGNPYFKEWSLGEEHFSNQEDYDAALAKYYDRSFENSASGYKSADEIIKEIDSL